MSRVDTKFDIRGLVLENTSLVHMALAVSHTRKIKSKEGTRQHRTVRGRRGSGTCKSQQGSLGAPSNTGRQTNWSLGATPSGIVSLCESSEKRMYRVHHRRRGPQGSCPASSLCVGLVDVDLAGGITICLVDRVLHLLVIVALLSLRKEILRVARRACGRRSYSWTA